MTTYTVPAASAADVEAGWAGIEAYERATRDQITETAAQTLHAELLAAGIRSEVAGVLVEEFRAQRAADSLAALAIQRRKAYENFARVIGVC